LEIISFLKYLAAILGLVSTAFYLFQGLIKDDMQKYKVAALIFVATVGIILLVTALESNL